ncbi:MAG: hypothetical protein OXE99_09560, partial [Cellvibrionales bacterium]|nr:hypothetical protein [Cellvibrionales bacterium]
MSISISNQIKEWLLNKNTSIESIDDDQDILESRVLDSLQFVNFLMFIESIRGNRIEQEDIVPENFKTVNVILSCFFQAAMSGS